MAILNYSTKVSVDTTLAEIQKKLVKAGARSVMINYDRAGNPIAVAFLIDTELGERSFALPANIEAVWKLLTEQSREGKVPRRFVTREQAARVSWRIIKDWLEAQLALIETRMVSLAQVMLPYMQVGQTGQSLYEAWRERQLALPPAGESS